MLEELPTSHCVMCVPTYIRTYVHMYIACSLAEQGRVCELCQEMGQQREELLRETELLKSKLTGKLRVFVCECAYGNL